jgi:hypothetical protein
LTSRIGNALIEKVDTYINKDLVKTLDRELERQETLRHTLTKDIEEYEFKKQKQLFDQFSSNLSDNHQE